MTTKITIKTTCDSCNADISKKETYYPRIDILKLSCQNQAMNNGCVYAIAQVPLLKEDLYFCGFKCLSNYSKKYE